MRISKQHRSNPVFVASRDEAIANFAAAIGKGNPEFSPAYLQERATAWADKAIAVGAVVVR